MGNKQSYNFNEVRAKGKCITDFFQIIPETIELHNSPLNVDIDDRDLWARRRRLFDFKGRHI